MDAGDVDVTANYDITTTAGSLIINQSGAEWTVSLDDDTYTYDASAHYNTKTATTTAVSGETTIEYSFEKEGTYTTDLTSLTKTDAGEYTIYVKASNPSYSTVAKTEAKLTINPKAVTVAAKPASKVYGDTDPEEFETTISGLIGTDTVTYSISREVGENAGEYDITPAGNEIQGNYKVTYTTAKFTITPKPVVLEWDNTVLFYIGEPQSTNATVTNKAFATDTFTIGYASVPAENRVHEATDVDDYIAEVVSLGNDNYTLTGATGVEHTWKIKYYLDIDAILVGNLHNGWYTGDVDIVPEADYAGVFEISLDRETWSDKLTYTENGDYEVIFYLRDTTLGYQTDAMSKTFKIDAIAPTGEIDAGLNPFKTFINEISYGYFFKDNVDIVITGEDNGAAVNSGVDTVEYQKVLRGETYNIDGPWTKEEGDTASFSVPATEENVIYARITDVAGHSVIISTDGLVVFFDSEADTAEVVYTRTTREEQTADVILNKNVIKEVADEDGALEKDTDYTISADGKSITLTADYLESKAAGRYTITVSYNPLGEIYQPKGDGKAPADTEFDILVKKAPGNVDITKVTNKIYDGKELDDIEETHKGTGTVTIEYKKVGEPDSAYTTEVPKDAGQYVVRVTVGEDENYEEAFDEKMVTINKRRITITPDDKEIVYGDPEPELTGTVENMAEGETLDVSYSRKKGTDVGEYKIKATAEPSDNYEAVFKTGKLTIVPKDISGATVTLGKLVVYTGGKQKQEIISVIIDGLVATWTVTGNEGKEPGKYTMEFTGNGNFCGTCYQDWLIVKQNVKADEIGDIVFEIICEEGAPETRFAMDESELIKAVISANEAAAVANGDVLIIWLEVKDISKTISAESKELLEKFAGEKTIGAFVDISLYKQLISEPDATHIRETASKIRIAMGLPSSLISTDSTKEREYTVARNHEGQAELIESEYDKTNKELYLYSDRFSDYAIMYQEKNIGNNPGTADRNNPWLWASAMAFMAAGGGLLIGRRRKKKDDEEE